MAETMVAMLSTSARLLELLSLLQSRRDSSGAELAWRLEVDVRTIRRDIERLRQLGYSVNAARGVAGGYRLGAGASLPPLLAFERPLRWSLLSQTPSWQYVGGILGVPLLADGGVTISSSGIRAPTVGSAVSNPKSS